MRLGIELSAAACRLVEIDGRWRPGSRDREPRVRSFAVLPPSGPDTDAMLASLKGRDAAVVVWGTPSEHRQVVVTGASYEAMRREAVAALASLGVRIGAALADIAPVPGATGPRRPVVVALAAADPMIDAIRPLLAAGIRVRGLATPAMALASMAVTRRGVAVPDAIEAYIAVEETATCIGLMRDGALAIARELPWGYIDHGALRPRDDMAERLASELQQYIDAVGAPRAAQVCICGGVPELRTMSVLLTERLDIEVEPLDSLFGIDEARLPEPAADFRDRVAELRLAWAVAADWPPHLNLFRARRRERSRRLFAAAAIAAGVTAGVVGAWGIARSDLASSRRPTTRTASAPPRPAAPASRPAPARPATPGAPRANAPATSPPTVASSLPPRAATPPAAAPPVPPRPVPPPLLTTRTIVPRASALARVVRPPQPTLTPMLVATLRQAAIDESRRAELNRPVTAAVPSPQTARVQPPPVVAPRPVAPPAAQPPASTSRAPEIRRPLEARKAPASAPSASAGKPEAPESIRPVVPPPAVIQRPAPPPPPAVIAHQPARSEAPTAPAAHASDAAKAHEASAPAPSASAGNREAPDRRDAPARPAPKPPPRLQKPEPVLPFDASLETILYSADRKLAIVDGRIVGIGDLVRGARIVEITPTAVMLRDGGGRLRRLALGAAAK